MAAGIVCGFGGMILLSFLIMPSAVKEVRPTKPPDTLISRSRWALAVLLVGIFVFFVAVAKERQWESKDFEKRAETLAAISAALANIQIEEGERRLIVERLQRVPQPAWVTDVRKLIYIDALICAAIWAAAFRWGKWVFGRENPTTSPSLHPQSALGR
jgi:hypothetical protein